MISKKAEIEKFEINANGGRSRVIPSDKLMKIIAPLKR